MTDSLASGVAAGKPARTTRRGRLRSPVSLALLAVLAVATILRLYGLLAGIPYAVGIDEPAIIDRALRMDRTGDLNPHFFDYPSLVFYVQAIVGMLRYVSGLVVHQWRSMAEMDAAALYPLGRGIAAAVSVAGVWVAYRAGKELHSAWTGVVAAALLAVYPQHIRESHFILTDVPATTFATLALWLAFRAARIRSSGNFALAGLAAGLAAASKYNGAFVIVPIIVVALLCLPARRAALSAAAAATLSMVVAFLVVDPWVILDSHGFGHGFSALVGRFEQARHLAEPAWLTYLKHLGRVTYGWLPAAGAGALFALLFGPRRRLWAALVVFVAGYYYVVSAHPPVFARYALPLVPGVCLCVAYAIVRASELIMRGGAGFRVPAICFGVALTLWFSVGLGLKSVQWVRQLHRIDTREMAADWLRAAAPRGSHVAVENFGPTNLDHAGFGVVQTSALLDNSLEWYRANDCEYLVVSWSRLTDIPVLVANSTVVFRLVHGRDQWGPDIQILQLSGTRQ